MQFISNKISVGKTKSFDEICQEFLAKKNANVKTASTEEAEVKVAEADEAEGSGQLEVEPLHQEGESTNQDSVAGGKSDGDGGKAPTKASDEEGESSGQPEAEGKEELNNDPYDDPKVKADADSEIKEAEAVEETEEDKEASAEEAEAEEKEADSDSEIKEAGEKGMCDCGKPNFICKGKCKGEKEESDDDEGEEKEASSKATKKVAFKKIANLTSEEKARLGKYWKNIYPDAFVDALLADK